jgi:hypothetical protein
MVRPVAERTRVIEGLSAPRNGRRVFRLVFSGQTTGFCDRIPAKDDPKAKKPVPPWLFWLNGGRKSARDRCHLSGMPV